MEHYRFQQLTKDIGLFLDLDLIMILLLTWILLDMKNLDGSDFSLNLPWNMRKAVGHHMPSAFMDALLPTLVLYTS